jgi:hypothetical protein
MALYIILLVLNLLGMGYLFYVRDVQKEVNTEFLKNAVIVNAVLEILRKEKEDLAIEVYKLKEELENLKNK